MKTIIVFFLLCLITLNLNGRTLFNTSVAEFKCEDSIKYERKIPRNIIFLEALGNGILGSVNYMHSTPLKEKLFVNSRIGFFYINWSNAISPIADVNTEISLTYGKTNSISSSLGISYGYGMYASNGPVYRSSTIFLTIKPVEYRLKSKGGFFLSSSIMGIIAIHEFSSYINAHEVQVGMDTFLVWPSIGIGFTF